MPAHDQWARAGANLDGVDPRLLDILSQAAQASPYTVQVISGHNSRNSTPWHPNGLAVDVQLYDKNGKAIPNYQDAGAFRPYEEFAQTARDIQSEKYPDLGNQFRWGGYFSGPLGKYGALDTMHFDIGGAGMGGGSWDTGLNPRQKQLFPGIVSIGMKDRVKGPKLDADVNSLASLYGVAPSAASPSADATSAAPTLDADVASLASLYGGGDPTPGAATGITSTNAGPKPTTNGPFAPGIGAFAGGYLEGLPVVGPYVRKGAEMGAAKLSSLLNDTSYDDEMARVNKLSAYLKQEHPTATGAGDLTGGLAGYVGLGAAAPSLMGLTGSLGARMAVGGVSNALLGAADAGTRSDFDPGQMATGGSVGGVVGGLAPPVGKAVGAGVNKLLGVSTEGPAANALQAAADFGIPVRADQASTSPLLNKIGQMVGLIPGSGMAKQVANQRDAFTRSISQEIGENTANIDRATLNSARQRIGGKIDEVMSRTDVPFDDHLVGALSGIEENARATLGVGTPEYQRVQGLLDNLLAKGSETNSLPGKSIQATIASGSPLDNVINGDNSTLARYAGQVKSALMDGIERNAVAGDADAFKTARAQYSNLVNVVAPLATKGVPGEISPALVQGRVNQTLGPFAPDYPIVQKADIGQMFLKAPKDSGTPAGNFALDILKAPQTWMTAALGGAGAASYYGGVDPLTMAKSAAAMGLGARGVTMALSNPVMFNRLLQAASTGAANSSQGRNMLMGRRWSRAASIRSLIQKRMMQIPTPTPTPQPNG